MSDNLLNGLTPAQQEAVYHTTGPCLVIAGAGTGKTKVITHRIAHLIQQGVDPERIVALTFTDKAAREMEERVDKLVPYGSTGTIIATFHSFCSELLKRHAFLVGIDPDSRLMSAADEISFLRQHLAELPIGMYKLGRNPVEFLKELSGFISRAQDEFLSPERIIEFAQKKQEKATTEAEKEVAEHQEELGRVYAKVQDLYREHSLLSYGDLHYFALQILKESASARQAEQERIEYLLIDEFQDTNTIQNEVAKLLVEKTHNIMVVGDDDQSIYSFRGANLNNILTFSAGFPDRKLITLRENFRSYQPILNRAYQLIQQNNPDRLEVIEKISKELIADRQGGDEPEFYFADRGVFEYKWIAEKIAQLLRNSRYQPNDIAVLVRAKSHLRGIEAALQAESIPSSYQGDIKFYDLPVIQACHSFLRFLTNPHDNLNLFFCLQQPAFQVEETSLQKHTVNAKYRNASLWEILLAEKEFLDDRLQEAVDFLQEQLRLKSGKSIRELFVSFIKNSGWYDQLIQDSQSIDQLTSLVSSMQKYEETHRQSSLEAYIQHVDYLIATDEEITLEEEVDRYAEGVQIMTVHKSKGLEFPIVFVVNMVEGRFPARHQGEKLPFPYELTSLPHGKEQAKQEERRIAYVALTRARDHLYLTASDHYESRKTASKISPFVMEAFGYDQPPEPDRHSQEEQLREVEVPETAEPAYIATSYSPSELERYQECPLKYKHEYVLKLPSPQSFFAAYGISLHETLRQWFAAQKENRPVNLEEIFEKSWIVGGYENKRHELEVYQEGLTAIRNYLAYPSNEGVPYLIEHAFEITLPSGNRLKGKIDRVDVLPNGRYVLIDYKSSLKAINKKDALDNLPLNIYALALKKMNLDLERVELHFPMPGEIVSLPAEDFNEAAIEEQCQSIISQIQKSILTNDFSSSHDRETCRYCSELQGELPNPV